MNKLDKEQKEICKIADRKTEGPTYPGYPRAWNKFNGDVVCMVFKHFLNKHFKGQIKVKGPDVYIEKEPWQYDLLIVEKGTKNDTFTNAYPKDSIKFIIEVKGWGMIDETKIKQEKQGFNELCQQHKGVHCIHIGLCEIKYMEDKLRASLEPKHCVAIMQDNYQVFKPGQWEKLIKYIKSKI